MALFDNRDDEKGRERDNWRPPITEYTRIASQENARSGIGYHLAEIIRSLDPKFFEQYFLGSLYAVFNRDKQPPQVSPAGPAGLPAPPAGSAGPPAPPAGAQVPRRQPMGGGVVPPAAAGAVGGGRLLPGIGRQPPRGGGRLPRPRAMPLRPEALLRRTPVGGIGA